MALILDRRGRHRQGRGEDRSTAGDKKLADASTDFEHP
jgi:hypothetical protein